jgi:hypothetical protein
MLFLFVEHAFDVGDLLEVEAVQYRVKKIDLQFIVSTSRRSEIGRIVCVWLCLLCNGAGSLRLPSSSAAVALSMYRDSCSTTSSAAVVHSNAR